MGDWVKNPAKKLFGGFDKLPTGRPIPAGTTSRQVTRAEDLNDLRDFLGDLRDHTVGWVNLRARGAKCDGVTDDTTAILSLLAEQGTTPATLIVPGPCKVTGEIAIPTTLPVRFEGAGAFVGSTVTFTPWAKAWADIASAKALAAQAAAEVARDAANAAGKVFPDTTAGIAGVADGAYFSVPSGVSLESLILYRRSGALAVEIKRYPSADLGYIAPAFDIASPKNKYNPTLAVDGKIGSYANGTDVAYPDGIISGRIQVTVGKTYVFSTKGDYKGLQGVIYLYATNGAYLGLDHAISTYPVVAGVNSAFGGTPAGGGSSWARFTVPAGVGFVQFTHSYQTHDATIFDAVRNGYMLEEAAVATSFEAYGSSGSASLKVSGLPSTMAKVASACLETAGRNKFNGSLAVDGQIGDYTTGLPTAFAQGIWFGKHPVVAGRTYTISMPKNEVGFTDILYCYNSSGAYIGMNKALANYVVAPLPPVAFWRDLSANHHEVTFTVPAGSTVAFVGFMAGYSTHTTADFDRARNAIQLEEGYSRSAFVPYSAGTLPKVDPAGFADDVLDAGTIKVHRLADVLYVRTRWSETEDLVQKLIVHTGSFFSGNDVINFAGAKLIPNSTAYSGTDAGYAGGTTLASQGDDATPANYNGTYIGANHGPFFALQVTSTGHGKTNVDVGSEWTDGAARKWYLMRVVDANTLWILSENIGASANEWNFATSLTGGTLTHSSGATNTAAITVGASALTQLYPIAKDRRKSVLLDGLVPVVRDGVYSCRSLDLVEVYDIPNVASIVDWLKVNNSNHKDDRGFNGSGIPSQVRTSMVYRFAPNGSCTVYSSFRTLQNIALSYVGFVQAGALTYSGKTLLQYIPKVTSFVGSLKTWNFSATEDITSQIESFNATPARWADANNPPDRMAQIVKSGSTKEFGFVVGYSPLRGVGVPATRKTVVSDALFLYTSRKMYPKGLSSGASEFGGGSAVPANRLFEAVAYRCFYDLKAIPEATVFAWFFDGTDVVVLADFHQAVTMKALPLPSQFNGKTVTVIEKSSSFTLESGAYVSPDGLLVSVTGSYGYAVLKLQ